MQLHHMKTLQQYTIIWNDIQIGHFYVFVKSGFLITIYYLHCSLTVCAHVR